MRTLLIATAGWAVLAVGGAEAQQRVVMHGPGPQPYYGMPGSPASMPMINRGQPMAHPGQPMVRPGQPRWGSKVGGRWWGGVNAPGGWSAYHRPYRGWTVPGYWIAPRFYITDWSGYGLSRPDDGANWVRYYDDAVLVDGRGMVQDTVSGVDWDRYDDGYYTDDTQVYADAADRGYAQGDYAQRDDGRQEYRQPGYAQPARPYDERGYRRESNGVGGAVAGAVVGGVAGNLIAGRGNRLGGTLIGAGVGTAAGYAIDRSAGDHRGNHTGAPVYGAPYRQPGDDTGYRGRPPVAPAYAPPPPPPRYAPPAPMVQPLPPRYQGEADRRDGQHWSSADGSTTVTTTTTGGYAAQGYYHPGGSTTTVVVQNAPEVTTTTTEIYEDSVTYVKPAARRVKTKRIWRPRPVCRCN